MVFSESHSQPPDPNCCCQNYALGGVGGPLHATTMWHGYPWFRMSVDTKHNAISNHPSNGGGFSLEIGHRKQGFIQALRRGQGLGRKGPFPNTWWTTVRHSVTSPALLLLSKNANNNEKTAATKVISCPLKFSQFTWQQHPHLPLGIWQRTELPACAPALGDDIKIALCKGWLSPERSAPKATQKNQGVVAAPSENFNYRLWWKPGHTGASPFYRLAVPVIPNGLCDPLHVDP